MRTDGKKSRQMNICMSEAVYNDIQKRKQLSGAFVSEWFDGKYKVEFLDTDALEVRKAEIEKEIEEIKEKQIYIRDKLNPEVQLSYGEYDWWITRGAALISSEMAYSKIVKEFKGIFPNVALDEKQLSTVSRNLFNGVFHYRKNHKGGATSK